MTPLDDVPRATPEQSTQAAYRLAAGAPVACAACAREPDKVTH
jgi:hypothetical protein